MKKKEKEALYESIMLNVSKQVKAALNEEWDPEDAELIVFHPDYGKCAIRSAFEADTTVGDFYEVYCIEGDNEEYLCELPFDTDIDDEDAVIAAIDDAINWEEYKADNGIDDNWDDDEVLDDEDLDDEDLDESYGDDEDWDDEDIDIEDYDEPKYTLVGCDGNAFAVMGYVANAMKKEGKSQSEIRAYRTDAMSSDYDNLLAVSMEVLDELNKM